MKKFNKSLLSLATIVALTSGATANSYLPLTSQANDNNWIMFGVNGFLSTDVVAGATANFTTSTGWSRLDDPTKDDIAVSGWNSPGDMGEVKIVNDTGNTLAAVRLNIDLSDKAYSETEPVRSMYIDAENNGKASVLLTYKASLEGSTVEFQIGTVTTTTYTFTISHLNTYDDPATRTTKTTGGTQGSGGDPITAIADILDYDMSENPTDPDDFDTDLHITADTDANVRMYSYNPSASTWEIYDRDNNILSNDFTELKKGSGYWGRIDLDAGGTSTAVAKSGLVLSASDINASEYGEVGLTADAWNLISFDKDKADITMASTGLVLGRAGHVAGTFEIINSSNNYAITVTLPNSTSIVDARAINMAIEEAKSKNLLSDTMNIVAIPTEGDEVVLISDKRFYISDTDDGGTITGFTTLSGNDAWSEANGDVATATLTNALGKIASVYSDYSVIIEPILGKAVDLQFATGISSAAIAIDGNDPISISKVNGGTDVASIDTAIEAVITANTLQYTNDVGAAVNILDNSIQLDVDMDGTADSLILVSATKKFYVEDHTFTRGFTYDPTNEAGTDLITINGGADGSKTFDVTATTRNEVIDDINAETATTHIHAAADTGANDIVIISAEKNLNGLDLLDSAGEFLVDKEPADTIGDGAIANVYSLGKLAQNTVSPNRYTLDFDWDNIIDEAADTITLSINGNPQAELNSLASVTADGLIDDDTERLAMWDEMVSQFNTVFATAGTDLVASHDYTLGGDIDASVITIIGYGTLTTGTTDIDFVDNGGTDDDTLASVDADTAIAGMLLNPTGDLSGDLAYTAVYTPSFPTDGPLYTLKELGFDPQAILTGNTDLSDGSIGWSNIDLTKAPAEWAANKDFNLFTTDSKSGYWAYLETDDGSEGSSEDINVSNVNYTPTYIHHFNTDGTVANHLSVNLNFDVSGLPVDKTPVRVYATIGKKIEFASTLNDGSYSTQFGESVVKELAGDQNHDLLINVANGEGYYKNAIDINTTIDLKNPAVPTVVYGTLGLVTFSNPDDTDVAAYHVYDGAIAEADTTENFVEIITPLQATDYNLGASLSATAFGTTVAAKVFAVDGQGTLVGGNVSPVATVSYEQMLKKSVLLKDTQFTGNEASALGEYFNDNGVSTGDQNASTGVSIKSVAADEEVRLIYGVIDNISVSQNLPNTVYLHIGGGTGLVQVMYENAYAGEIFYVKIGTRIFKSTFPAVGTQGTSSTDLQDVSGTEITNGQTF